LRRPAALPNYTLVLLRCRCGSWLVFIPECLLDESQEQKVMSYLARLIFVAVILMFPALAVAGSAEDASAAVERWSAAYNLNDPEVIASTYTPDALLLGTVSPIMSEGREAIVKYFTASKGSGNKNMLGERRTIVLGEDAAVVAGFYEFSIMRDGQAVSLPARFTMLVTRRDGEWRIAHHHSSPRVLPKP
jgi:uncharacterized protein (TIGR02246 family)